jgi:hypothetical protein
VAVARAGEIVALEAGVPVEVEVLVVPVEVEVLVVPVEVEVLVVPVTNSLIFNLT